MSLLDDARRLNEYSLDVGILESDACPFCGYIGGHDYDCPWLSMSRLVAALEAADALVRVWKAIATCRQTREQAPWSEIAQLRPLDSFNDEEQAARRALVAAIGEPEA